jgi:hypothetical protein
VLEVTEDAEIAFEGCKEMITIPGASVSNVVLCGAPFTTFLISRQMNKEVVILVGGVTRAAPHRLTSVPGRPGGCKVAAE